MKHLAVLTFAVVAAICVTISYGVSSKYGTKGMHDQLLHREYVIKSSSWWRTITKDVKYPPPGYINNKVISAIYVTDQTGSTNTSTGYASLAEGGPGSRTATVHLKSPKGLNFTIEFYGYQ